MSHGPKLSILRRWLIANVHFWDADWFVDCVSITCMWRGSQSTVVLRPYAVANTKGQGVEMCLAWLYQLVSVPLILLTNAYEGCGRPTLHFVERFWFGFGSVRSAIDTLKWTQRYKDTQRYKYTQMNWKSKNKRTAQLWLDCTQDLRARSLTTWSQDLIEAWDAEVRTWLRYHCLSRRATR